MTGDILQKIRETNFFKELSDDASAAVADKASMRKFAPNEAMMRKDCYAKNSPTPKILSPPGHELNAERN